MRADTWGPVGAAIAAACCVGFVPVLTALTAVGLGFLLHDAILIPLLVGFLALTLWQLVRDRRRHGRSEPLVAAAVGSVLTVVGVWVSTLLVGLSLAAVFAAALWNLWLIRQLRRRRAGSRDQQGEPA